MLITVVYTRVIAVVKVRGAAIVSIAHVIIVAGALDGNGVTQGTRTAAGFVEITMMVATICWPRTVVGVANADVAKKNVYDLATVGALRNQFFNKFFTEFYSLFHCLFTATSRIFPFFYFLVPAYS